MVCVPRLVFVLFVSLLTVVGPTRAAEPKDATIDFNRDIRPLLSDRCFQCHGPDETHREAGLRLDQRASAVAEADSGEFPIVPGDADASELMARLIESDGDYRMPPEDSGKKALTPDEVALFRSWIEQGAEDNEEGVFDLSMNPLEAEVPASLGISGFELAVF
mgnify:CR=1 FL=1